MRVHRLFLFTLKKHTWIWFTTLGHPYSISLLCCNLTWCSDSLHALMWSKWCPPHNTPYMWEWRKMWEDVSDCQLQHQTGFWSGRRKAPPPLPILLTFLFSYSMKNFPPSRWVKLLSPAPRSLHNPQAITRFCSADSRGSREPPSFTEGHHLTWCCKQPHAQYISSYSND